MRIEEGFRGEVVVVAEDLPWGLSWLPRSIISGHLTHYSIMKLEHKDDGINY